MLSLEIRLLLISSSVGEVEVDEERPELLRILIKIENRNRIISKHISSRRGTFLVLTLPAHLVYFSKPIKINAASRKRLRYMDVFVVTV